MARPPNHVYRYQVFLKLNVAQASLFSKHFGGTAWLIFLVPLQVCVIFWVSQISMYAVEHVEKHSNKQARHESQVHLCLHPFITLHGLAKEVSSQGYGLKDSLAVITCGSDVPHRGADAALVGHGHQFLNVDRLRGARPRGATALSSLPIGRTLPVWSVRGCPPRCNMSIVDGGVHRDRGRRTGVLINLLVENRLQLLLAHANLVQDDLVVHRASGTLDSGVGAEVEVVFVWVRGSTLDQGTWQRVSITVSLLRKEANMMTLASNDDHKGDVEAGVSGP